MTAVPMSVDATLSPMAAPCDAASTSWSAAEVAAAARALEATGHRVIRLEVGEPDFATAPHVVEAAVAALRAGETRYAPAAGLPVLREAVAADLARRGVAATPEQVVVAPGAKLLIACVALATLDHGDEVLVPDPGYPSYAAAARMAGARPVAYPVAEDGGVDVAAVAARLTARTRALVLNSPGNPTGGMLDATSLAGLAELAQRHDLLVITDEIYSRLVYAGEHRSIATLPGMAGRTVLVDGFSKTFAMTGWRLAYGLLPAGLVRGVTRRLSDTASCTPPFVQHAGVAALDGPAAIVAAQVAELRARRDALVSALAAIDGVTCAAPAGGLYVFPCVAGLLRRTGGDAEVLARTLLHEEGVACVPGTAFGERGAAHLRLALSAPVPELLQATGAIDRISRRPVVPPRR